MKKKKQKKKYKKELYKNAIKIKCQYCEAKATCIKREAKEKAEKEGIMTYCMITPNKPKGYSISKKIKR